MSGIGQTDRQVNIKCLKGSTLNWFNKVASGEIPRNYTQADLDALTLVDVHGKVIQCVIQPNKCVDGKPLEPIVLSTDTGEITTSPDVAEKGIIRLKVSSTLSESFNWTDASYEVVVARGVDDKIVTSFGKFTVFDTHDAL